MIAVVGGMIATFPVGGVFYDYVQYAVGLERLGFDVWYLEDTTVYLYDLEARDYDYDLRWERGADHLERVLSSVSPNLGKRWHLRGLDDRTLGVGREEMVEILADADIFLNVSGICVLRDEYLVSPRKVFVDTDPGWNHFMRFPKADRERPAWDHGFRAHDHHFTYATRLGAPDCPLPDFGLRWHPTRPPVVPDLWETGVPPGPSWTTVLSWDNAPLPMVHEGVTYGTKEREFVHVEELPGRVEVPLEIAAGGTDPPVDRWRELGWSVVDSLDVSRTPQAYREYVTGSRGELSVAKNVYAATRCGWFSCRSICYMAAGRPVVLQDTGFSEWLPTGEGVLAFEDADGAAAALERVEQDYETHAAAARRIAREHFDAELVLGEMLDRLEVDR